MQSKLVHRHSAIQYTTQFCPDLDPFTAIESTYGAMDALERALELGPNMNYQFYCVSHHPDEPKEDVIEVSSV